MKLVFLDFDGVLRRSTAPLYRLEEQLVKNFESVVLGSSDTFIVISSSWREAYGLAELKRHFSMGFAKRIEGLTPRAKVPGELTRYKEILAYLMRYHPEGRRWLAIDDDPSQFPEGAPLMTIDAARGFDSTAAEGLKEWLANGDRQTYGES